MSPSTRPIFCQVKHEKGVGAWMVVNRTVNREHPACLSPLFRATLDRGQGLSGVRLLVQPQACRSCPVQAAASMPLVSCASSRKHAARVLCKQPQACRSCPVQAVLCGRSAKINGRYFIWKYIHQLAILDMLPTTVCNLQSAVHMHVTMLEGMRLQGRAGEPAHMCSLPKQHMEHTQGQDRRQHSDSTRGARTSRKKVVSR
jgi:hypothetical protein